MPNRNFKIIDVPQRSPEWFAARVGRMTGSRAKDMLATIKSGEAAARRDLRTQLVVERLTGQAQEPAYVNDAMQWGIDHEAQAFNAYEVLTGQVASRTGFLAHTEVMAGCSLDGHIGDFEGILEVKCPKSATHWGYLRGPANLLPPDHLAQITHNLFVTGAQWCDFLSYDPRFPSHLWTFMVRVTREQADLDEYERKLRTFLEEVDREVDAAKGWRILEQASA
jgi:YqaJ-like recombinase protein